MKRFTVQYVKQNIAWSKNYTACENKVVENFTVHIHPSNLSGAGKEKSREPEPRLNVRQFVATPVHARISA